MRIQLKTNFCGPLAKPIVAADGSQTQSVFYAAGTVVDLNDKLAKELIEAKSAISVPPGTPLGIQKRTQRAVINDPGEMATLAAMNA